MKNCDVIIVGGGLAGLTAAIHLSALGFNIIVIEKNNFPKHKVCGEYISNEVMPYLKSLDLDLQELKPANISKLHFSTASGRNIATTLPLGGFGLSRYALDHFMVQKAIANGCHIVQQTTDSITFEKNVFTVKTTVGFEFTSGIVLGAFGKRSNIDLKMQRDFTQKKSPWLAVKGHYSGSFPDDVVGLHSFKGGYCGVSMVENGIINVCYLADYATFKDYRNITDYQQEIVAANPNLKAVFETMSLIAENPLTISQVSFDRKKAVDNHMLMIGDSAGLIHPLCGNGMAMAVHSAKIASELVVKYLNGNITRNILEKQYEREWNFNFRKRLRTGRWLAALLQNSKLSMMAMHLLTVFPFFLPMIINKTHGKPILP